EGKTIASSPTRALWMFLPKQEGGLDNGVRLAQYNAARIPQANILVNLDVVGVTPKQMPRMAWEQFSKRIIDDLFYKYDIQPREMYLRGHRDAVVRRQERMDLFVDNPALVGLASDGEVRQEIGKWLNRVSETYAGIDFEDAKKRAAGQKT